LESTFNIFDDSEQVANDAPSNSTSDNFVTGLGDLNFNYEPEPSNAPESVPQTEAEQPQMSRTEEVKAFFN